MTAESIIAIVRRNLADTHITRERWPNSVLLGYLSEALAITHMVRPDLFLADDVVTVPPLVTSLSQEITAPPERYRDAIAAFTTSRALMEDSSDDGNVKQGKVFMEIWERRVLVK